MRWVDARMTSIITIQELDTQILDYNWIKHTPGAPMPCSPSTSVEFALGRVLPNGLVEEFSKHDDLPAGALVLFGASSYKEKWHTNRKSHLLTVDPHDFWRGINTGGISVLAWTITDDDFF